MSLVVRIKKDFGSFKLDVDFVTRGGTTALLGASGSGKTMTLKCIAGLVKPDEGYIELNGRVLFDSEKHINLPPQKRKVGYMFQNYALFPNMNVRNNIMVAMKKIPRKFSFVKEDKFNDVVKMLELEGLENRKISQLSGGQQQRVALARILVNEPDIILLDEPFSALDNFLRVKVEMDMKRILSSLKKEAILVTHDRDEAYILSKDMVLMNHGKNIIHENSEQLFNNPIYLEASILTGCKNNVACQIVDEHALFVPQWNITYKFYRTIPLDTKYIGIRAHSFSPIEKENSHQIVIDEIVSEPFEYLIRFRFIEQNKSSPEVLYRLSKKEAKSLDIKSLGVKSDDILFLKD